MAYLDLYLEVVNDFNNPGWQDAKLIIADRINLVRMPKLDWAYVDESRLER